MIKLLSRSEIFKLNPVYTDLIMRLQDEKYNPRKLYDYLGAEADKEYKSELWYYENNRDKLQIPEQSPYRFTGQLVLFHCTHREKFNVERFASDLKSVLEKRGIDQLFFMQDYSTPWLFQENDYPRVLEAVDYFRKLGVGDTFNGGFAVSESHWETFIPRLFWLLRCNAALNDVYFSAPGLSAVLHMDSYGYLFFELYDIKPAGFFKGILRDSGFVIVKNPAELILNEVIPCRRFMV